jgi:hypothetical protein
MICSRDFVSSDPGRTRTLTWERMILSLEICEGRPVIAAVDLNLPVVRVIPRDERQAMPHQPRMDLRQVPEERLPPGPRRFDSGVRCLRRKVRVRLNIDIRSESPHVVDREVEHVEQLTSGPAGFGSHSGFPPDAGLYS